MTKRLQDCLAHKPEKTDVIVVVDISPPIGGKSIVAKEFEQDGHHRNRGMEYKEDVNNDKDRDGERSFGLGTGHPLPACDISSKEEVTVPSKARRGENRAAVLMDSTFCDIIKR